jgi:hypothetical protein
VIRPPSRYLVLLSSLNWRIDPPTGREEEESEEEEDKEEEGGIHKRKQTPNQNQQPNSGPEVATKLRTRNRV